MNNFGDGQSPEGITYAAIAEQIKAMNPRALTGDMLDDALTMIEYVRDEALRIHDENEKLRAELEKRIKEIKRRERDAVNTSRIARAVIDGQPRRLFNFGR